MNTITKLLAAASALTLAACQQGGGETNTSNALENASEAIENAGEAVENASDALDSTGTNGIDDKPTGDVAAEGDNSAAGEKPTE